MAIVYDDEGRCIAHGLEGPCSICDAENIAAWVTKAGHAYHLNPDCPALKKLLKNPVQLTTVLDAKKSKQACMVCVSRFCTACAVGNHRFCNAPRSLLESCACAEHDHAEVW